MALLIIAMFVLTLVLACCAVGISLTLLFKAARMSITSWRELKAQRAAAKETALPAAKVLRHA